MQNTRSSAVYESLFVVSTGAQRQTEAEALAQSGELYGVAFSSDNGPQNQIVFNEYCNRHPTYLASLKLCDAHDVKHVEIGITAIAGVQLLSKMYSALLLMKMSGNYVRFYHSLDCLIDQYTVLKIGKPPTEGPLPYN